MLSLTLKRQQPQPQQPALNGHADDTGEWRAIAEVREKHIGALTKEVSDLKRQVLDLRADVSHLPLPHLE